MLSESLPFFCRRCRFTVPFRCSVVSFRGVGRLNTRHLQARTQLPQRLELFLLSLYTYSRMNTISVSVKLGKAFSCEMARKQAFTSVPTWRLKTLENPGQRWSNFTNGQEQGTHWVVTGSLYHLRPLLRFSFCSDSHDTGQRFHLVSPGFARWSPNE